MASQEVLVMETEAEVETESRYKEGMSKEEIETVFKKICEESGDDLVTFKKKINKWVGRSVLIEIAPDDCPD